MNYLAFDTSAEYLTVIAKVGGKSVTEYIPDSGVRHSEQLMPCVEKAIESLNASVRDIDVFCSVTGPGSFTGIRIGVSTAKGFVDALNKKILGVTTFDALAYNIKSGRILAVIDAKHSHYYVCGYENLKVVYSPRYVDKDTLNGLIEGFLPISFAPVEGVDVKVVSPAEGLKAYVEAHLEDASSDPDSLKPFYLRLSQAEEGRK